MSNEVDAVKLGHLAIGAAPRTVCKAYRDVGLGCDWSYGLWLTTKTFKDYTPRVDGSQKPKW